MQGSRGRAKGELHLGPQPRTPCPNDSLPPLARPEPASPLLTHTRYREAFAALGTTLEDQGVQLARVGPAAYRCFFETPFAGAAASEPTKHGVLN